MSRPLTISTFSTVPPAFAAGTFPGAAVDHVIAHWRAQLRKVLADGPDLILLPEIADQPTGHHDELDGYLAARGTRVRDFFAEIAREYRCHIAYTSLQQDEQGGRRNTMLILDREGRLSGSYDKRHVVIDEYEDTAVQYGTGDVVVECDFGRVACAICFDIYFDEARTRVAESRPDLVLFSSMVHGGLLQSHWAYSCNAHFVAALHIMRPSAIVAPTGEILATTTNYFDYVMATINLDCGLFHLDHNRPRIEAARAKYGDELGLRDPGYLGAVLLSSEAKGRSIDDIAREFDLEPLSAYLDRSRAHRHTHAGEEPEELTSC